MSSQSHFHPFLLQNDNPRLWNWVPWTCSNVRGIGTNHFWQTWSEVWRKLLWFRPYCFSFNTAFPTVGNATIIHDGTKIIPDQIQTSSWDVSLIWSLWFHLITYSVHQFCILLSIANILNVRKPLNFTHKINYTSIMFGWKPILKLDQTPINSINTKNIALVTSNEDQMQSR